ncbi:hypothetical protein HYU22_04275 [Candidatus Woesearchaeota archaeon]|nr:hypothetical protein [Candidatus Woesearchaeota archaeon]
MVNKMILPQEIETFYVIPALRKHLALELDKNGMKQKDVAAILGINTAAISQYRSAKRGGKIHFNEPIVAEISTSASRINDRLSYIRETQRLLRVIRAQGVLCTIHKQLANIPEQCEPKSVGCQHLELCA